MDGPRRCAKEYRYAEREMLGNPMPVISAVSAESWTQRFRNTFMNLPPSLARVSTRSPIPLRPPPLRGIDRLH